MLCKSNICIKILLENLKAEDHLEILGVARRIILKWILKVCQYGKMAGSCEYMMSLKGHERKRNILTSPETIFLIHIVGEWSPNWVRSARRPLLIGHYLPRVIVRVDNLVE
jgi:hypothetical protein